MRFRLPSREGALAGFVLVVRLGLGAMFIASSLPKIRLPFSFLSDVYGYELVGPKLGVLVAMTLPWVELLAGVCLVGGVFVGGALLVSIAMGAMFTFVLASALYRQLDISCGCFSAPGKITYVTLVRAIVIMVLSGAAYAGTILAAPKEWLAPAAPAATERQDRCAMDPAPELDAGIDC